MNQLFSVWCILDLINYLYYRLSSFALISNGYGIYLKNTHGSCETKKHHIIHELITYNKENGDVTDDLPLFLSHN